MKTPFFALFLLLATTSQALAADCQIISTNNVGFIGSVHMNYAATATIANGHTLAFHLKKNEDDTANPRSISIVVSTPDVKAPCVEMPLFDKNVYRGVKTKCNATDGTPFAIYCYL